jgi:hypothetical protein
MFDWLENCWLLRKDCFIELVGWLGLVWFGLVFVWFDLI